MFHEAHLTINLNTIIDNYLTCRAMAGGADVGAAVKANAYGQGMAEVSRGLADNGCNRFFVAHLAEGISLRALLPRVKIYVLNGLPPLSAQAYQNHALIPVLGSREEVEEWASFCARENAKLPAALMVETGMNRLGLPLNEAVMLTESGLSTLPFTLELVMSHYACADEPNNPLNSQQARRFAAIRPLFVGVKASLSNSAGLFLNTPYDVVRPGIALYGGNFMGREAVFKNPITLKAPIIQVKTVGKGETIGYSATYFAPHDIRVAYVSLGYADGYMRAGQGNYALFGTQKCAILGRISMDIIAVSLGETKAKRGDMLTFLGEGLTPDVVATAAGSISYELLTRLSPRLAREYVGG